MKSKKFLTVIIHILFIALIFQGCSKKEITHSLTCKELSNELESEISVPEGAFKEYTTEELRFLFSSPELFDDICIVYSNDSTDVCEIGVLYASNEESAKLLFEDAKSYIKSLQEQKSEFLRNYSPAELSKLNSAEVRRYGNYIIFTVAEADEKNNMFKKAEALLSKK